MAKLNIAVVGVGNLGQHHARIYAGLKKCNLVGVVDINRKRAQQIARQYNTEPYYDHRKILDKVDAVSVVVPTVSHYQIARDFLERGVHVLVEKPITSTLEEAEELVDIATRKGIILQVGHIEHFNVGVQKLKEIESDADTEKVVTKLAKQVQTIEDASYNAKVFAGIKNEVQLEKVNLNDIFYELTEIIYDRFSVLPELFVPEECNLDLAKDDFLEAVKQVVFNSCESIGEDVIVKISATCSDEYAEVLIEDNGAGIPNESIDDIFDPFFSFGKQNHIGLGLSIADKIISNLAGKIAVKKTSGDGTVFSILLPLPVE